MKSFFGVLCLLAMATFAVAQRPGTAYEGLKYDKATEARVAAVVEEVQQFDCPISQALGHHVVVKTTVGPIVVHTAPVKFLQQFGGIDLKAGDQISVLGSKLKDSAKRDTILAREIVRGSDTFIFRDQQGRPLW